MAKTSEDDTDKTSVKSDRPKCRYWDKCFRKNPDHLKNFRPPAVRRKGSKKKAGDENDEEDMDTTETKTVTTRTGRVSKPPQEFKYTKPPAHKNIPQVLLAHKWTERYTNKLCKHNLLCKYQFPYLGLPFVCSSSYSKFLFTSSTDPKGWWMSEKLDGLRAYWDGKHFFSRLGNSFHAPEWFIKDLPHGMELDGELFGGRGKFQSTVSIVKGGPSDRWKDIKFHVSHPKLLGLPFLFFPH